MVSWVPSFMNPTATAIAALLLENVPNTYCYPCLTAKLQLTDKHDIRAAAHHLVLQSHFEIRRLRCATCGAEGDFLGTPPAAPRAS
jgi:hypothetical protein